MNLAILTGRVASIHSYDRATKFTIAIQGKDRDSAEFIDCVAFRHNKDFFDKYFIKGQPIEVTGSIHKSVHEGVYKTEVYCDRIEFRGAKWTPQAQ